MPLYVLTAETMACNIRQNPRIHGLRPPDSEAEVKLSQFADDTTLLLTDEQSITETFNTFDLYERASGAKINKGKCKGLWCGAFARRTDQLFGFEWYNDFIPDKILGQYFGNVDCTQRNWEAKIQKINDIIAAWRHRDLSLKGKALLINTLLTSTLWYNVTSLSMPPWAVSQIERSIYAFFWSNKHPLVNREILALPLGEGGFNIPLLQTRIYAFRLNTLKRLLSVGDAHWKYFTAYFLRVANMKLGKMTLVLDYSPQRIDGDIPAFHRELLMAWYRHKECHTRTQIPELIKDVLNEPLFLNDLITSKEKPLLYTDWIAAGITRVKDICYEAVPGFLPPEALHEILTDSKPHALSRAIREYRDLLAAIPKQWLHLVNANHPRQLPTLQPCFVINTSSPGSTPHDLVACKTRTFYHHLHQLQKPTIPAIDKWKEILQPAPDFSTKQ